MSSFAKKAWSTEEEQEMLSALRRREPFETIASRHDRTPNAIRLRFGMVCRKELSTNNKRMADLCREYGMDEAQINRCIQSLEDIQKKNAPPPPPPSLDPADIAIIKEEVLLLHEKVDKIYKCVRKLLLVSKK
jgi:hypothetical protein